MSICRRRTNDPVLNEVIDIIAEAAETSGIYEDYLQILSNSEKKIEVSLPILMDDKSIKLFKGLVVQHSTVLGPSIGSISIKDIGTMENTEAFAMLMSLQTALLGIPLGGSKGVIVADTKQLSPDETERLYKAFVRQMTDILGQNRNVIKLFENDSEYTSYPIIDVIEKKQNDIRTVVNRPEDYFGTGWAQKAHSVSIAQCVKKVVERFSDKNIEDLSIGLVLDEKNIDIDLLCELDRIGLKIDGTSDGNSSGCCTCTQKIWDIILHHPWNFDNRVLVPKCNPWPDSDIKSLLTADVDIIVLQNPEARITSDIAEDVKAKYIIEADENLISSEAEIILEDNGMIVVPDFISLGGVLINAYIEWTYGAASVIVNETDWKNIICKIVGQSLDKIWAIREKYEVSTRKAAVISALQRITDIREKRGFN